MFLNITDIIANTSRIFDSILIDKYICKTKTCASIFECLFPKDGSCFTGDDTPRNPNYERENEAYVQRVRVIQHQQATRHGHVV